MFSNRILKAYNGGISVRTTQIFTAAIILVFSAFLLSATFKTSSDYKEMREATERYMTLKDSADDLQLASDYLTEQVRCYAETGETMYMENYFKEAKVTKRREKALDQIRNLAGSDKAYKALKAAMDESVALMDREYYSMKLTAEAYGMSSSKMPYEVRNVKLKASDASLSVADKEKKARDMVFDSKYHTEKSIISANIHTCLDDLYESMESRQANSSDDFENMLNLQRVLIATSISASLIAMIATIIMLVGPLLRAVGNIRAGDPLPTKGAREFKFLARTYNVMYEENKKKTEKLSYDAKHDHLTELYNRSAYDFFMDNINLNETALIIADVDKFKQYNDKYGHDIGDQVLRKTATVLRKNFRSQDYVCRLGGDEFAVILLNINREALIRVSEKINRVNEELADTSDGLPVIHVSAGAAHGMGKTKEELFRAADASMYEVKERGGNGYSVSAM